MRKAQTDNEWHMDSGCSHHMTGNSKLFSSLTFKKGGKVVFGDNSFGRILGHGSIDSSPNPIFSNVLLVDSLKHNLLSISQLCDYGNRVSFESNFCFVETSDTNKLLFVGSRKENIYSVNLLNSEAFKEKCFSAIERNLEFLWHRRLGHASLSRIAKLSKLDLVRGLPKFKETKEFFCHARSLGKQTRSSFKTKIISSTSKPLELLHIDLFGPCNIMSIGGKFYTLVVVDDFSRFTWVKFLVHKNEALSSLQKLISEEENQIGLKVKIIRSDHGGEFESHAFDQFRTFMGIRHEFSAPRTPQQNGIAERKNRALLDLSRTMLADHDTPKHFWAKAVATACYVLNRTLIRKDFSKTPYEMIKLRKPKLSYFHPFGCKCFVLNTKDTLGKFDPRSSPAILLGYSTHSKAFRVFNLNSRKVEESINVVFDEETPSAPSPQSDDDEPSAVMPSLHQNPLSEESQPPLPSSPNQAEPSEEVLALPHILKRHPPSQIIGNPEDRLVTRSKKHLDFTNQAFLSTIEPKHVKDALNDEF
ncbi:Retrovirus-related Pol polyprotein from transposon TNT 1-94 [Linum perenne]